MSKSKSNKYTPSQTPHNHSEKVSNKAENTAKNVIPDEVERKDGPGGN